MLSHEVRRLAKRGVCPKKIRKRSILTMAAEVYSLFSSSKGNSCLVKNGADLFLIDAGVSAKRIRAAMQSCGFAPEQLRAIFITHEHSDHIGGLDTLCKQVGVPVYIPSPCYEYIRHKAPSAEPFLRVNDPGNVVELSQTRVLAVQTPHDACGSVGFRIDLSGEIMAYFTDIGHLSQKVVSAMSGCARVVIESNHDLSMLWNGGYPELLKQRIAGEYGHLSNESCAKLLAHLPDYGTKRVLLAHLSEENNTPGLARLAAEEALCGRAEAKVAMPDGVVEL